MGAANKYSASNLAPAVAVPFNGWVQIISNTPDIIGDTGPAQYLWYQPSVDINKVYTGETAYFCRAVQIYCSESIVREPTIGIHVSACADNAFLQRVSLIGLGIPDDVTRDISGGILSISQSSEETAPFNW